MFKRGDRVVLRADNRYGASRDNPAMGSPWACEGVVCSTGGMYSVDWDNGSHNGGYRDSDLDRARKPTHTITDW